MIINLKLLRSAFFFLGDLCLTKNGNMESVNLDDKEDSFKKSLALSIHSGVLESDVGISDIVNSIKDLPTRIDLQRAIRLPEDVIEIVVDTKEVKIESTVEESKHTEEIISTSDDNKNLEDLLTGSVKQVVAKIKEANLGDEEKLELMSIEESGKNRSIVIAAINEA